MQRTRGDGCIRIGGQKKVKVKGRLLDLSHAFKQLTSKASQRWASVIGVWNPDRRAVEFFIQNTLAFGQSGAVLGFNRVARAIRIIANRLFSLMSTNYFDDYSHIEVEGLKDSAQKTMEGLMELLGWEVAFDEKKRQPFRDVYQPLGVEIDLTATNQGRVSVRNKDERCKNLVESIDRILANKSLPGPMAASLVGRMLFTEQQVAGRCGVMATGA